MSFESGDAALPEQRNPAAPYKLENVYDNDVERWFSEEGYEKEFNINLSDCDYLFVEDALFEEHNI